MRADPIPGWLGKRSSSPPLQRKPTGALILWHVFCITSIYLPKERNGTRTYQASLLFNLMACMVCLIIRWPQDNVLHKWFTLSSVECLQCLKNHSRTGGLLGLLVAIPHNLCSYWSVSWIEIFPSLPPQGGRKSGICRSGPRLRWPAAAEGSRTPRGWRPQDRVQAWTGLNGLEHAWTFLNRLE